MLLLLEVRMRILEIIVVTLLLFLVIYLACFYGRIESRVYACSEVGYPVAIDVPQEVIEKCRKVKKWQQN
jgi:uncharacterized protein YpmB